MSFGLGPQAAYCAISVGQRVSTHARYMCGLPVLCVQDSGLTLLSYIWAVCGLGDQAGTHLRGVASAVFQTFILPCMGGT